LKAFRRANVPLHPGTVATALRVVCERPVDVMANVQVRVAVAIQVGTGRAGAPQVVGQARLPSNLDEAPSALAVRHVLEQGKPAPAGDEQIGPAVTVEVGDSGAVRVEPGEVFEAYLSGHVLKLEAAQVLEELAGVAPDLLAVEVAAAGEENVEQTIAIVVEQSDA